VVATKNRFARYLARMQLTRLARLNDAHTPERRSVGVSTADQQLPQGVNLGRRRLEDCDAAKVYAIKRALAAKRGVRQIARDLKTGVGTVLRIKSELAA
jgi:hypothetical protein